MTDPPMRVIRDNVASQRIESDTILFGMIEGDAVVCDGVSLDVKGTVTGSMVVQSEGRAEVYGTVVGSIVNEGGDVSIYGRVGRILSRGNGARTMIAPGAIVDSWNEDVESPPHSTGGKSVTTHSPASQLGQVIADADQAYLAAAKRDSLDLSRSVLGHLREVLWVLNQEPTRTRRRRLKKLELAVQRDLLVMEKDANEQQDALLEVVSRMKKDGD